MDELIIMAGACQSTVMVHLTDAALMTHNQRRTRRLDRVPGIHRPIQVNLQQIRNNVIQLWSANKGPWGHDPRKIWVIDYGASGPQNDFTYLDYGDCKTEVA